MSTAESASGPVTTEVSATPKVIVHHLNNSRSQRVLWLLEELEVPYEIKKYERTPEMLAPKEMKAVHPLGVSPIIEDGNVKLAESGAIVEYIIAKYGEGKARPAESGKLDDLYFSHYAEGSIMPLLVNKIIFKIVPGRTPFFIRPIAKLLFDGLQKQMVDPRLKIHADYIEAHLSKSGKAFFADNDHPTSADFMMLFPLEGMASGGYEAMGPSSKQYVERMHARPAYKRALEKGGEYAYAKL